MLKEINKKLERLSPDAQTLAEIAIALMTNQDIPMSIPELKQHGKTWITEETSIGEELLKLVTLRAIAEWQLPFLESGAFQKNQEYNLEKIEVELDPTKKAFLNNSIGIQGQLHEAATEAADYFRKLSKITNEEIKKWHDEIRFKKSMEDFPKWKEDLDNMLNDAKSKLEEEE